MILELVRLTKTDGDFPVGSLAYLYEEDDSIYIVNQEGFKNDYGTDILCINGESIDCTLFSWVNCLVKYGYEMEHVEYIQVIEGTFDYNWRV